MDAALVDDIPLFCNDRDAEGRIVNVCLGWFPPDTLREMISRKEAHFEKRGELRCVVLNADAPALLRVRALSSSGATQALSTTYTEDLYPDSPEQLKHKKNNGIPVTVTAACVTLKKYRGPKVGFVPWTPEDRPRRRRYNPDTLRPLYWSARAAEAALLPPRAKTT